MKIAVVYDKEKTLKPLDGGEVLAIIDDEKKVVEQYENPGYQMSKEASMEAILDLGAEAIVVKERFLCPGSYAMSVGRLKYIPSKFDRLNEILDHLEELKKSAAEELEPEMYAEDYEEM
ncbi:hypothetical protein HS1genome_1343 [Sulfodiicoccus acidiphilus]|uniref:Dinitrogenase iron-molybdenum cofactor biosynthesis domain-containing protein n=1 Tax=Sulfodiicoccus acidiphilus TaxID=1670455 RepID=A0A348B452_9CREN|nr:hypothetical protein [Sulfodiicoccus acidiphilus]BBD72954.1 hypothetical protein HS1genome_1343 [Sulfodiicoccus acidiphilus]GGT87752.1 hypothetical protein GCM10007116_02120 [Sulfodiicoccus acidiphilus]